MLPVLDFHNFLQSPHAPDGAQFCRRLVQTCHDSGFFFLTGHGVDPAQNDDLLAMSQKFFALPARERHEIAIARSPHFRGYTLLGDELTQGKNDWRDQLDIGPEEEAIAMTAGDPDWLRLRGPNQWPSKLPELQGVVSSWAQHMNDISMELFRALALGLGHDYHYFDHLMTPNPYFRIKISRYPAQTDAKRASQGLGLHHDSGLFTLITQNEVPGLQIQRDGELQDIEPLAGAFIVNLGEMFQIATNGFLKATRHQVKSPPLGAERISIAYFMNPRLDAVFEPIPLPPEIAALAPGGQNPDPRDPIYATFGENTLKIRKRSHPDVVAAHYASDPAR